MRSLHHLSIVAAGLCLSACEFIPGTDAYKIKRAKQLAVRDLIDPNSAQFRDVVVRGAAVCGELNGKNRMGAYTGFSRFVVDISSSLAHIDPHFDFADLISARDLCSSIRSNPYSYGSSLSACERATEKEMEQILQRNFDDLWKKNCETSKGRGSSTGFSLPLDTNLDVSAEGVAADTEAVRQSQADPDVTDANADDLNAAEPAPSSDSSGAAPARANRRETGLDQQWLDDVFGRSGSAPSSNTDAAETEQPIVDADGNPINATDD
jgi:hypothetical protein